MARFFSFRRIKHAAPVKLKVLAEDLRRPPWLERLSTVQFCAVLALGSTAMASAVYAASHLQTNRYIDEALRTASKFTMKEIDYYQTQAVQVIRPNRTERKIGKISSHSSGCDANYDGCVPIASDVDCQGGTGNGPAITGRVQVIGYDVYGLDGDGDGIGCE